MFFLYLNSGRQVRKTRAAVERRPGSERAGENALTGTGASQGQIR